MEKLALLGGTPVVTEKAPEEMFKWPIITQEDIDNVMWKNATDLYGIKF